MVGRLGELEAKVYWKRRCSNLNQLVLLLTITDSYVRFYQYIYSKSELCTGDIRIIF